MGIMFTSETSKQYLLEEDAVEGFKLAVANGQMRLALQVLVDVVDGIMEVFDHILADEAEEQIAQEEIIETPVSVEAPKAQEPVAQDVQAEEPVAETPVEEEKPAAKKAAAKTDK